MMYYGDLMLKVFRKHRLSSFTVVGVAGVSGYATYVENRALDRERQCNENVAEVLTPTLPRCYDWNKINAYWAERPVTTAKRFVTIARELLPVTLYYIRDFHVVPFLSSQDENSKTISDAANADKYEREGADGQHGTSSALLQREHASRLREVLTNLGPAFVKVGQQISIRPDLVPPSVIKELQKLCDEVRPIPDEVALERIREELKVNNLVDIFETTPHRVASASLGQVYKGKLRCNGKYVAIKVQRPGMQQAYSLDLFMLNHLASLLDGFTSIFTNQQPYHQSLFDTFARGSYLELDYENEAKNQIHFKKELEERKSPVLVPVVYEQYTTQHVLTTQWIDGIRLANASKETIQKLIPVGVELFLTQLLDIGAFHSDPHPGNLLVTKTSSSMDNDTNGSPRKPEEGEEVLCLLDFGLCAELDLKSRNGLTQALIHLLIRDYDSLISKDAKDLGFLPTNFDDNDLKPLLTKILSNGLLEPGSSNIRQRKRKLMEISNELNEIFFRYPFSVPPFFALITRGLGLLEGIALTGDPDFDIFRASVPYVRRKAIGIIGSRGLTKLMSIRTLSATGDGERNNITSSA